MVLKESGAGTIIHAQVLIPYNINPMNNTASFNGTYKVLKN